MSEKKGPVKKPEENQNSDVRPEQKSRRQLIQTLVAGGVIGSASAVPGEWRRPMVDSVLVPVHGGMTGFGVTEEEMIVAAASTGDSGFNTPQGGEETLFAERALNFVVEPAHAVVPPLCNLLFWDCIVWSFTNIGGGTIDVSASMQSDPGTYNSGTPVEMNGNCLPGGFSMSGGGDTVFFTGCFNGFDANIVGSGEHSGSCSGSWITDDDCGKKPSTTRPPPPGTTFPPISTTPV